MVFKIGELVAFFFQISKVNDFLLNLKYKS